ncbi:nuclear transport factor 2 family protein [Terrarubrum flagellatum]|uniref:nuclear transport factor 2 family protein n=1 Tax=Terrirubrum flagellatum TaxID=2895980 RepID=UPI0031452A8C
MNISEPISNYFAAKNRKDIDGMLASFDANASVKDEGEEHRGLAAIRAWMEHTTRKYQVSAEIKDVTDDKGRLIVSALVSGDFPGSPAMLRYAFKLSGGKIARLEIGA